jgi:hypothetical protein
MNVSIIQAARKLLANLNQVIADPNEAMEMRAKLVAAIALAEQEGSAIAMRFNLLKLIELLRSDIRLRMWIEAEVGALEDASATLVQLSKRRYPRMIGQSTRSGIAQIGNRMTRPTRRKGSLRGGTKPSTMVLAEFSFRSLIRLVRRVRPGGNVF